MQDTGRFVEQLSQHLKSRKGGAVKLGTLLATLGNVLEFAGATSAADR